MITYLYLNKFEKNEPFLISFMENFIEKIENPNKEEFPIFYEYENILIFSYLDIYEINFILKMKDISFEYFLKNLKINNKFTELINLSKKNPNKYFKFILLEEDEVNIIGYLKNGNIISIYGKIFKNKKILNQILKFYKKIGEKNYVAVINNLAEKPQKYLGENRNLFKIDEILYYIDMMDIHFGLKFFFIKHKLKEVFIFLNILKIDKLTNNYIEIKNSIKKLFEKKIRGNRKCHVLNISNIVIVYDIDIYEYKNQKTLKYYFKIKNIDNKNDSDYKNIKTNIYYQIKEILELNRKNIIKIKENYNRSNKLLIIWQYNNKKYIIKLTKSISNKLEQKLRKISPEEFLKKKMNLKK